MTRKKREGEERRRGNRIDFFLLRWCGINRNVNEEKDSLLEVKRVCQCERKREGGPPCRFYFSRLRPWRVKCRERNEKERERERERRGLQRKKGQRVLIKEQERPEGNEQSQADR